MGTRVKKSSVGECRGKCRTENVVEEKFVGEKKTSAGESSTERGQWENRAVKVGRKNQGKKK